MNTPGITPKEKIDRHPADATGQLTLLDTVVCDDPNVEKLRQLLLKRSQIGTAKYGCTTFENPLSLRQWLEHALLEGLDKCIYLQAAITEFDRQAAITELDRQAATR